MAAIDKIYTNKEGAKEFINWIETEGDSLFKEYFKDAGNVSIKDFMYVKSLEKLNDIEDMKEFSISIFPTLVDKWLFTQKNIPKFVYDTICYQYSLDDENAKNDFAKEKIDTRPIGNHLKIIERTGVCKYSNYFENACIEIDNHYYRRIGSSSDKYITDIWWYREETDDWESTWFPKRKNLCKSCYSAQLIGKKSLKSIIRKILKKYKFPIGTVIKVSEFRYYGDIYLKVIK